MWSERVVLITGASRGIGAAFSKLVARRGARVVLTGRSVDRPSHRRLEGTLVDLAREIHDEGHSAEVHRMDVRDASEIADVIETITRRHDRIDLVVNNASAVDVSHTPSLKAAQLMLDVNARGALLTNLATVASLEKTGGQIITLSPPLEPLRDWLSVAPAYALSKYGMTMATLGFAERVKANCLWPKRTIATAATAMLEAQLGKPYHSAGRSADYFAEAMMRLLEDETYNGRALLDEDVLPYTRPGAGDAPLDMFVGAE